MKCTVSPAFTWRLWRPGACSHMQLLAAAAIAHGHLRAQSQHPSCKSLCAEHLVFPGDAQHLSLRALPGMAGRALRVGSAGKTFSFTGWKGEAGAIAAPRALVRRLSAVGVLAVCSVQPIRMRGRRYVDGYASVACRVSTQLCPSPLPPAVGWMTGPARLVKAAAAAHQFLTFTVNKCVGRG